MDGIQSIRIQNYRSHKDTFIEFDKGVNLITGSNDCGKSNILKAINTVVTNRPSGEGYFSHWGDNMSIRIDLNDKAVVRYKSVTKDRKAEKYKAGNKNFYVLINKTKPKEEIKKDYKEAIKTGKDSGCVEVFKSFGQGVPEKIKSVLNMNSINLSSQFAKPFLLDDSPTDVAKFYNKIVNLDVIDSTISNISKTLKSEKRDLKTEKLKNDEKQEDLKSFNWIEDTEKLIQSCEKIQKAIKKTKDNWSSLFQKNKEIKEINEENEKINKITRHKKATNDLIDLNLFIKKKGNLFDELEELENKLNFYRDQKRKADSVIVFEPNVDLLINLNESIQGLRNDHKELLTLSGQLEWAAIQSKKINKTAKHEEKVNNLIELNAEVHKNRESYESLELLSKGFNHIGVQECKYADLTRFSDMVNALSSLNNEIDSKDNKYNELFDLAEGLDKHDKTIVSWKEKQDDLEKKLKELMPDECPLCGK